MLSRATQIARMRRVALAALAHYDLPDGTLSFVDHGENTTFRHDSAEGRFLVRVHRPQRHGRDADPVLAIESELAWLTALRAQTGLEVPEPLHTRSGGVTVQATAGDNTRVVSVLRWQHGRVHENSPRPAHLRRLGAAMATLHRHADAWTPPSPFQRIDWNHEAFFGDVMVYGGLPASEVWLLLPDDLRERFQQVADRLATVMAAEPDHGLIHADLHLGNAVFEGDRVKLIDFDDCGVGHRLYDVAVALWEQRDRDDYDAFRTALLDGYRRVRDVDVTHLDDFIALRQVAFALWYTGTAQVNPAFADRLDAVNDWSHSMLDLVAGGYA
jgi:Ser/Thr protein kinase RdoA (MazF antagonist)